MMIKIPMAKVKRPKQVAVPPVGSVFLMPLGDGRYGTCRVIRYGEESDGVSFGGVHALVVASRWIGTAVPSLDEPLLREPLIKTHHSWSNQVEAFFVMDEVPVDFQLLGTLLPTNEDMNLRCLSFGHWKSAPLHVLIQWRWDNDREALLADDEVKRQKERATVLEKQRQRQNFLASVTLSQLRDKERFATWGGSVSDELIDVCRHIFAETIDSLLEFEGKPPKKSMVAAMKECVTRLNELDTEQHFIETIEREDLCQEIDEIVHACRFPKEEGIADRWRDW